MRGGVGVGVGNVSYDILVHMSCIWVLFSSTIVLAFGGRSDKPQDWLGRRKRKKPERKDS